MDPIVAALPKAGDVLLGKYLLERVIGQGGMGVVFAARHELLGQRVAVKLVHPSFAAHTESVARFVNEARASARIENDHVARVLDVGTIDGKVPYMVLEYLDGEDLEHLAERRGRLPIAETVDYMLEAIEGVAYAHALGIVHRDLKPSNLFLAKRQDGTARVKVLDFGISKMSDDQGAVSVTRTNSMLGSPLYMSPEQLRNAKGVDHRSDIWAFGVIAYELMTGTPPFMGDNAVALFAAIQETDPQTMTSLRPDGSIEPALEAIVLKCLKRRPDERFQSVADLARALAPFGTPASASCVENAARILAAGMRAPVASAAEPSVSSAAIAVSGNTFDQPHGQTAGTWSERVSPTRRSPALLSLAILSAIVAVIGAAAFLEHAHRTASAPAATQDQPATATSAQASAVATAAPIPSSNAPSAADAPSAAASSIPSAPTSSPHRRTGATPKAGATDKTKMHCDPPYDFDASGKKVWKPECL